jgi:hypothetical protein
MSSRGISWGVRTYQKIALGIWALVFFVFIAPFAIIHNWKVGTLPVVEGTLSNHQVVEMRVHKTTDVYVKATLEFDGPIGHCKHDNVRVGSPYRGESFAANVQVAVRTDSCHGYFFLPLTSPGFFAWFGVFLFVGFILLGFVTVTYHLDRSQKVPRTQ